MEQLISLDEIWMRIPRHSGFEPDKFSEWHGVSTMQLKCVVGHFRPITCPASFSISASQASLSPAIVQKMWYGSDGQGDTTHE